MATYTTDQYTALVAAIATGSKFVKYADKEVEYRSLGEMNSLKRDMEIDLGLLKCASRYSYRRFQKMRRL